MSNGTDFPIEILGLSPRAHSMLRHAGVTSIRELLNKSDDDLMQVRNLGRAQIKEIKAKLVQHGYLDPDSPRSSLGPEPPQEPYLSWGEAIRLVLTGAQEEAMRFHHASLLPQHLLLSVLRRPETAEWLAGLGQRPDNGAMVRKLVETAPPAPIAGGEIVLPDETKGILLAIRHREPSDNPALVHFLVLKALLRESVPCRSLLAAGEIDPAVVESALVKIQ